MMTRSLTGLFAVAIAGGLFCAAPATALTLPFGLPGGAERAESAAAPLEEAPIVLAQAGDASVRFSQMEEEMRRLTGKVEEMSFLVLQLQEQLRSTQAENDLRLRDLEGGATPASGQRGDAAPGEGSGDQSFALGLPASSGPSTSGTLAPPDAGNDDIASILSGSSVTPSASASVNSTSANSQTVASIDTSGPVELYSQAYNYMLAGDYQLAEQSFRQYSQTYPDTDDAPDATYWLGESLFAQSKYRDAAEVFLNAQKAHPDSGKAPEMMLKLGMSLARLENRDTACVTYAEVGRRYPGMSASVKRKLDAEESAANCG